MTATTCGLTRWHPFLTCSAPSKACILDAGHAGDCRDQWGGIFEGSKPRPRALTPDEVDAYNRATFAEDEAEEAPTCDARRPGYQEGPPIGRRRLPCVLPAGHDGRHTTAFRDTFAETDVPDAPHADSTREAARWHMIGTGSEGTGSEDADTRMYGFGASDPSAARTYGFEGSEDIQVYGFEGSDVPVIVPTPDMLAEAVDGEPVMHSVYGSDTSALGTLAANDALTAWLPTTPDGTHGPLVATLSAGAEWLAATGTEDTRTFGSPAFADTLIRSAMASNTNDLGTEDTRMTRADTLAHGLSRVLNAPGLPENAGRTLKRADRLFGELDALLRAGKPVPAEWNVHEDAHIPARVVVTVAYDAVSEHLRSRERSNPRVWQALLDAGVEWERLTGMLRAGSPLPDPWQRDAE